jgi:hypothetical protein
MWKFWDNFQQTGTTRVSTDTSRGIRTLRCRRTGLSDIPLCQPGLDHRGVELASERSLKARVPADRERRHAAGKPDSQVDATDGLLVAAPTFAMKRFGITDARRILHVTKADSAAPDIQSITLRREPNGANKHG